MIFDNHSPINFENAEEVAKFSFDRDFGFNFYRLMKGKMFHLYHAESSGYDYGHGTKTYRTYLFGARTLDEVRAWLREKARLHAESQPEPHEKDYAPYAAPMLEKLGDFGDEA